MATTSPDNLRTPNPGDPYNLVADLATFANDVQNALNNKKSNLLTGTAAQRVAATGTATAGMLWQDTDGIKMIWRKDGASWVPAVWRWSGTTAQMNAFAAPNGFEWFNSTDNSKYDRVSGAWVGENAYGEVRRTSASLVIPNGSYGNLSSSAAWTPTVGGGVTWQTDGFVVPTAGRYRVWWTLQISGATSGNSGLAGVKRASKPTAGENMIALAPLFFGGAVAGSGSAEINLEAADKLQLWGFGNGTTLTVSNAVNGDAGGFGVTRVE